MAFDSVNLTPRIGTEIKADRKTLLGGGHAKEIRALLESRGVLVFRGLYFTDEEQLTFSRTLGDVIPQGDGGIYKIALAENTHDTVDMLKGTFCWHIDGTTDDIPTRASLLTPRRLSQIGGQTEFANTYAAYDDLSDEDKTKIDKLKVIHMQETIQRIVIPNPTDRQLARWRSYPTKVHPLVWTHQSGCKSLVLGLTATNIEGMDAAAGKALIDRLQAWASQPKYVYRHEWQMGDLLIWDNTGVMHRVEPYPVESQRLLSRTTLVGEEALA